jgi:serine/threonine-protein kinase
MVESAEQLAQRAFDLNLLNQRQMEAVWGQLGSRGASLQEIEQALLGLGFLTNYQFDRLARGERTGFFYGDYKVLYLVGTGSFARVYRAVHTKSGEVFALKVLRRRFSENPVQTEQFLREGRMGAGLRHLNIVPIHEVFSAKRMHYLVMEFVEGQNLRDFLKVRKKLPVRESLSIATDITAGLGYAADRGITHRDLKLSNVLVSSSGRAKLVDFGLAAATEGDNVEEITNPRTIDYAGLERATGVRKDDPRSDIFFNGCMFYQMLTGQPPLSETRDRLQRLSNSRFQEIKPVDRVDPELPRRLTMIVRKAMELNPEKRYQSQNEMLLDLRAAARQLKEGRLDRDEDLESARVPLGPPKSVMIVESNPRRQDRFRALLKKEGYRALVMRDPGLALQRFERERNVADCVVFSCLDLGSQGLDAFNRFTQLTSARDTPAILLLDKKQQHWQSQADAQQHRIVLTMPVTARQLRRLLQKLIGSED